MVPRDSGFNLSETVSCFCACRVWHFLCSPATARNGENIQRRHFYHYRYTICHIRSWYVTIKLHGMSTADATIMQYFQTHLFTRFLPSPYASHVNLNAAKHCRRCQSSEMAALLNSLFFVFKISFLPKYRVIYYDYIVKWCSGIYCNWCV